MTNQSLIRHFFLNIITYNVQCPQRHLWQTIFDFVFVFVKPLVSLIFRPLFGALSVSPSILHMKTILFYSTTKISYLSVSFVVLLLITSEQSKVREKSSLWFSWQLRPSKQVAFVFIKVQEDLSNTGKNEKKGISKSQVLCQALLNYHAFLVLCFIFLRLLVIFMANKLIL